VEEKEELAACLEAARAETRRLRNERDELAGINATLQSEAEMYKVGCHSRDWCKTIVNFYSSGFDWLHK